MLAGFGRFRGRIWSQEWLVWLGQEVLGEETQNGIREFGRSRELREHVCGRVDSSDPRRS